MGFIIGIFGFGRGSPKDRAGTCRCSKPSAIFAGVTLILANVVGVAVIVPQNKETRIVVVVNDEINMLGDWNMSLNKQTAGLWRGKGRKLKAAAESGR